MRNQQLSATRRIAMWRRMTLALSAVLVALVLYVAPNAVSAEVVLKKVDMTAQQARLTHGGDLYNELCAVCHGMSGAGDGPAVPALKQRPLPERMPTRSSSSSLKSAHAAPSSACSVSLIALSE